jgi:hypothetical protein
MRLVRLYIIIIINKVYIIFINTVLDLKKSCLSIEYEIIIWNRIRVS